MLEKATGNEDVEFGAKLFLLREEAVGRIGNEGVANMNFNWYLAKSDKLLWISRTLVAVSKTTNFCCSACLPPPQVVDEVVADDFFPRFFLAGEVEEVGAPVDVEIGGVCAGTAPLPGQAEDAEEGGAIFKEGSEE